MCANGLDDEMMVRFIDLSVIQQEIGFHDFFGRLSRVHRFEQARVFEGCRFGSWWWSGYSHFLFSDQ
jgi:hypothetical protein